MNIGDIVFLFLYLGIVFLILYSVLIVSAIITAIKSNKKPKEEISEPKDFKTQMEEVFIPAIQRMIDKEEIHLEKMRQFSLKHPEHKIVYAFIIRSEQMLHHLKLRHKEYSDYCKMIDGMQ